MLAGPQLRSEAQHIDTFISFIQHGASHQRREKKRAPFLAELEQNSRQVWLFLSPPPNFGMSINTHRRTGHLK